MRCLRPLTCFVLGPLALTAGAGLVLGSLACVALCAGNRAPAGNGRPATPEDEAAEGRAGAPDAAARARRRRAL